MAAQNSSYRFPALQAPCKLCQQPVATDQDLPLHWQNDYKTQREGLDTNSGAFDTIQQAANSDFRQLAHPLHQVQQSGANLLWMLRGLEALGENDYKDFLQQLGNEVIQPPIDGDVRNAMVAILGRDGNTLNTVVAMEHALNYNYDQQITVNMTRKIEFLPSWTTHEVDWLRQNQNAHPTDDLVVNAFQGLATISEAARPGRSTWALAVWLYKVRH